MLIECYNRGMNAYADIIINRKSPAVDRVFTYAVPPHLRSEAERGMLALVPFNRERLEGVIVRLHDGPPQGFAVREILDLISQRPLFSEELLRLAAWMSEYYLCSRAAAMQAMLPAGMTLSGRPPRVYYRESYRLAVGWQQLRQSRERKRLIDFFAQSEQADGEQLQAAGFSKDYLRAAVRAGLLARELLRVVEGGEPACVEPTALNQEQQAAYAAVLAEREGQQRPFLLHGVTGSGKTEIYLRLIESAAAAGRQSIVLVPEIALSTQMVEMLSRRLDLPLAVLHSGLKPAERRSIWQDIAEGRVSVVVGPRSAVFAPAPALGLIILDEEHETSYKQENQPRFSARTVAVKRAQLSGCQLVLGSATPSVESYYHAARGDYAYAGLRQQYYPAPRPAVDIVDMRDEFRAGNKSIFSRLLEDALREVLARGEQAVLFLNRRGYYQHVSCRSCGSSVVCPHCAVAMSYHQQQGEGRLLCHYCGRAFAPPATCPVCGSKHIRHFGIGTERVADELTRLLPEARVLRLDSDVLRERDSHRRIYRTMQAGGADILVGTQMVAKGLDFPRLQLAAVIAADTLLNLPDWRANERCFQLVSQLIGRAGRREQQGRAIIQTYTPEALPIRAAAAGDYLRFYRAELEERQLHGYPPFLHIIRLLFTAPEREALARSSLAYAAYLRAALPPAAELCGPAAAPLAKIKDRWRWQLLVKCGDVAAAAGAVEQAGLIFASKEKAPREWRVAVDVDPMNMM